MRRIGPPAVPLLPEGLPDLLPGLVWATDVSLHLTHVAGDDLRRVGPALEALRLPSDDPRALVGRRVADLRLGPDAVRAHELALAGERASYTVEWGGVHWLARVRPLLAGGAVVGVTGMAMEWEEGEAPTCPCTEAELFQVDPLYSPELVSIGLIRPYHPDAPREASRRRPAALRLLP